MPRRSKFFTAMNDQILDDEELRELQQHVIDDHRPAPLSFHYHAGEEQVCIDGQPNHVVWSMKLGQKKAKAARTGRPRRRAVPVCKYGHTLTAENVYTRKDGYAECKQCRKDRVAKSRWISAMLKHYQPHGVCNCATCTAERKRR